uniref:Polymerase n=1 Tax=Arctotis ophiovirus TaxID=2983930 RepID=A0A9N6YK06_9VIRU|nr:TPA_asm: polymerase [Arctotis ophiovirus]
MEWTDEKIVESSSEFDEGISTPIRTKEETNTSLEIDGLEISEEDTKKYNKEFDDLIETLTQNNLVTTKSMIETERENYILLMKSKEAEKAQEPENVKLGYKSLLMFYEPWEREYLSENYIDKPALLSRIDSPFKKIEQDNLVKMINEKYYPEKFGMRARIDLKRLRQFTKGRLIVESGTQDDMISVQDILTEYAHPSTRLETLFRFADQLRKTEEENIAKTMIKRRPIKKEDKIELRKETIESMWLLNLMEMINHKIKLTYSSMSNKRTYKSKDLWHEERKIKCQLNSDGSSKTTIKLRKKATNAEEILKVDMFLSHTFSAVSIGPLVYVGMKTMVEYLLTIIENSCTINIVKDLNRINEFESDEEENPFIDYVISLSSVKNPQRTDLAASYETICLISADAKCTSSSLPMLDAVTESLAINMEYTEKLLSICSNAKAETCIKMSGIGKLNTFAEVDTNGGLEKYIQRTNRNHKVEESAIENLRWLFRMKVITHYIKKYGVVPPISGASGTLEQELNLMAAGGSFNSDIITNQANYKNVKLGQMLQPGQEVNVASRVIDKACTKDEYDFSGNSVKELIYYITKNDIPELINTLSISKVKKEFEREYITTDRKNKDEIGEMEKYKIVRLVEKEKELKTKARFYGVASFKLKIYISVLMEMIKRAMKLIPGQMMTMTEDERRQTMHQMSKLLDDEDSYSLFLDYSGHNTSQRPENNLFIMEEISDMYGFAPGSLERQRMTMIVYLFSDINILYEELLSDNIMISRYQKGAIEGWFGPLWGIQSQLMMEDMMRSLNFTKYIGTTYSDDSCGVFVKKELDSDSLNNIIRYVQNYALKLGLLVKLSQTQVTNGRCSMLKNHYFKDTPIDMSYKRILSISPNNDILWGDDLERMMTIDSGFTSSTLRADSIKKQVLIRNYRAMTVIEKEVLRWADKLEISLDSSFLSNSKALRKYAEICLGKLNSPTQEHKTEMIEMTKSSRISFESSLLESYYHFNMYNKELLEGVIMLLYLPYSMYGYAMTSIPDSMISGFSNSNVKRITYVSSLVSNKLKRKMYGLINLSSKAENYIKEPFPLDGGRKDTKSLLKDELKKVLMTKVTNRQLRGLLELGNKDDERFFKNEILSTFQFCFSHRITSKFYECSIYAYLDDIYSKIDNSTTLSFFLGKKKMNKLWNKAWNANHMIDYKINEIVLDEYGFDWLITQRDKVEKKALTNEGIWEPIQLEFLKIEEIPIIGSLISDDRLGVINIVTKSGKVRTGKNRANFRLAGPTKTHLNLTKFDRDIEIEGMFSNKLIFLIYELVRYVKWIIMDMEKFSRVSEKTIASLMRITESTIATYSDCRIEDVIENVVCPKGGRYFHRAIGGGFNPKTGDLTSNIKSNQYEITGLNTLIDLTGGVDNNLNVSLLIVYAKVMMGHLKAKDSEIRPLTIKEDVLRHIKDVSFNLETIKPEGEIIIMEPTRDIPDELSTEKIKSKGRLYKNYSYFISCDQEIKGKFIDHKSVMPQEKIDEISSFKSLHKYMEDQEIISPEMIPDDTLEKIAPEIRMSINKDNYLDKFYKFYKGLNIIGNESYTKTVMRSIINNELLGDHHDTGNWIKEMESYGYSINYRKTLMKVFIISTCLVFRLEEINPRCMKMLIKKDNTKQNGINNLARMKRNQAHFHIRDKRVSELIMMAFPTSGYRMTELFEGVDEIYRRFHKRVFETEMLVQYYDHDIKHYIGEEFNTKDFGAIRYETIPVDEDFFASQKMTSAALKSYEMVCTIHCKPQHVSSPTMSDIYPSAVGVLSQIKPILENKTIVDLFAGRGDFHFAMTHMNIKHISISRNDGYNLINRVPGMIELKAGTDITLPENYGQYMNHDVFLIDVSHYTGNVRTLQMMIEELFDNNKTLVVRLNSIISNDIKFLQTLCDEGSGEILIPSIESPGYIYLCLAKRNKKINNQRLSTKDEENRKERKKKFTESIIAEKLTNEIYNMRRDSLFNRSAVDVNDHTVELISDETLIKILTEDENKNKFVEQEIEKQILKGKKIKEMIVTELEEFYTIDKNVDGKIKRVIKELDTREISLLELSYPTFRWSKTGEKNIKKILRQIYAEYHNNKNQNPEIEIHEDITIRSGSFVVGIRGKNKRDIEKIIDHLMQQRYIIKEAYQSLKTVKTSLEQVNDETVELERLYASIETGSSFRDKYHSYDRLVKIAKLAKKAYLGRNIEMVFLQLAGVRKGSMKSLIHNKTRSHRYDCMNFKLLLNRMILLHEKLFLDLIAKPLEIKELIIELQDLRKSKGNKSRSYETIRLSRDGQNKPKVSEEEIEERIQKEILALREFESLEEYLNDRLGNELFDSITSVVTTSFERGEMETCELPIDTKDEIENAYNDEIMMRLEMEVAGLFGSTAEEVQKNATMTAQEMRQELEEDCWEDYEM